MKRLLTSLGIVALAAGVPSGAWAQEGEIDEGIVEEITITIKTDKGTKTYQVDDMLELDDIDEGDKVRFAVEDDEIQLIEELDDDPEN